MKNKALSLLLAALMLAVIAVTATACFPDDGNGNGEIPLPTDEIPQPNDQMYELTIWGGDEYMGESGVLVRQFCSDFNNSPLSQELKVKISFTAMAGLPTALQGALLANRGPDLVIWDRFATPSNTDVLYPLNALIERDEIDLGVFNQEATKELAYRGAQFGLPLDLDPWGIVVNMDIVNAYNNSAAEADRIDIDTDLQTWSGLREVGNKLTVRNGTTVTRAGLNTTSMDGQFFSFVFSAGGEVINTDEEHPDYGDTRLTTPIDEYGYRIMDTLSYFKNLYGLNLSNAGLGGEQQFAEGKLAMTFGSMYFPQRLKEYTQTEMNIRFVPYPQRDLRYYGGGATETNPVSIDPTEQNAGLQNGLYGGMLGGYGLAIAYPDEPFRNEAWRMRVAKSWHLIKAWLLNDDLNMQYCTTTRQITSRLSLTDHEYYSTADAKLLSQAIPYLEYFRMRPNVAGYEPFEANVVRSQIQRMYEGDTVATVYQSIRSQGNSLLRQAQGRN